MGLTSTRGPPHGNVPGNVRGNVPGNALASVAGNVAGNVPGNVPGNVHTNVPRRQRCELEVSEKLARGVRKVTYRCQKSYLTMGHNMFISSWSAFRNVPGAPSGTFLARPQERVRNVPGSPS